ncbi:MAG: 16S rRNA (guanine(527)-N(7))-methyltransferase RsmG [Candidatus Desulfofervidaceae bacterium]|nr:16S rRNA (guanine(527)-N(7))-methyltransferase RsmG [Candidatus Desulfofervidaceae bacterium]MDL1969926.1 16S rRNA (guanine(527)-N(7))-methyltransferase RsmG [Candidatus Desulfofervidaceae bacterium]
MDPEAKEILENGSRILGIKLSQNQVYQFQFYLLRLKKWNRRINLTGLKTDKDIVIKHFLDSLALFSFLKPYWRVLDIGSGAGFPGIPLKIVLPSLQLTLVEARQKRVAFLKEIKRLLHLNGMEILQIHLGPKTPALQCVFDAVIGRAVAPLPEYVALAQNYIKEDGLILVMRGSKDREEELKEVCRKYSLYTQTKKGFMLPFSQIKREVVALKKLSNS